MNISEERLKQAAQRLRQGGTVVYPTETAYGLGANAMNASAVEKVYAIKGRAPKKTSGLIVANFRMARRFGKFSRRMARLARNYWPGALTLVVPAKKRKDLAKNVIREDGTIALRISSNNVATELSKMLNGPIVATSANVSGKPVCYDMDCVKGQFVEQNIQPDMYLDAGALKKRPPSTIVTEEDDKLVVLRSGPLNIGQENIA